MMTVSFRFNPRRFSTLAMGVLSAGLWLGAPSEAEACGGFFCNANQPVNQQAERIIFADQPDDKVTAVVQILYSGPAEKFAWVLPVPSVPEVGVSSNSAFQALQGATNPTYTLNRTVEGTCKEDDFTARNTADSSGVNNAAFNNDGEEEGGGVNVLASGAVGPYNYDVIEVEPGGTGEPVDAALDWLNENGYDISAIAPDLLKEYLDAGMKFIAFKLNKTKDAGDIRPVMLTYDSEIPMIPIKLTAVAATEDMGVLVWVLGESRAIPKNYKDLVLNDAIIDWFNPSTTYNNVVIAAANEAQGQGFVTEMADEASVIGDTLYPTFTKERWEMVKSDDWAGREAELMQTIFTIFGGGFDESNFTQQVPYDGFDQLIDLVFMESSDDEIARIQQDGFWAFDTDNPDAVTLPADFNIDAVIAATQDLIVDPVADTQALFDDATYMTRMYTTMSADEMTMDPVFDFNADLPSYDNAHTADYIIECHPSIFESEAPYRVQLPSGNVVRGKEQRTWPVDATDALPSASLISQQATSGAGEIVVDNSITIKQALDEYNATVPTGEQIGASASGGCSSVDGQSSTGLIALMLGLFGFSRRRRD